jgi:electron transfer flavoprotein alpha subunit
MSKQDVWVFIQQDESKVVDVSLELCSKARELADELGVSVKGILVGDDVKSETERLISRKVDEVLLIQNSKLKYYTPLPYTDIMVTLIKEHKPQIVLYGATTTGRDLAPRVASALKVGLTADCTDLQIGDHTIKGTEYKNILYQIRPAFGGNIIATIVSPEQTPQMATVREGVMKLAEPVPSYKGIVTAVDYKPDPALLLTEIIKRSKEEKAVDLKGADIIVAGGMGVGSADNFKLVKELADTLGGVVAASRAAVDSGFIKQDHQVGQTGTTVRPKLYIACGISGAVQHRAGMAESARIIAINSDPKAPIFGIAQYGIVGDLNAVIPKMIKAYKSKV